MIDVDNYSELDKYVGQSFWTWGYYIGAHSYKLSNIVPPTEVILRKDFNKFSYYFLVNRNNDIVGYYSPSPYNNFQLYESEEEARKYWNIKLQDQLDRLESEYIKKKNYLRKKFLK